jgi:hypothetical protein
MVSLLFLDSFDLYNANNNATRYPDAYGFDISGGETAYYAISSTYGRTGQGLRICTGGYLFEEGVTLYRFLGFGGSRSQWGFGFAVKITDQPPQASVPLLAFVDSATVYGFNGPFFGTQVCIYLSRSQSIRIASGEPEGTTLINSTKNLRRNVWHYVEGSLLIGNPGQVSLKIDGENVGSFTGDTRGLGSSSADGIRIGFNKISRTVAGGVRGRFICFDDFYITTKDTISDVTMKAIRPTGDGASSDMTPSTGSSHYAVVDDDTDNEDIDYLSAATSGLSELFTFPTPSGSGIDIPALQVSVAGKAAFSDPLAAAVGLARVGGVTYTSTPLALGTPFDSLGIFGSGWGFNYRTAPFAFTANPNTGGTWTPSDIGASQFGVRRTA